MALLILSQDIEKIEDTLKNVAEVAFRRGLKFSFQAAGNFELNGIEVYLSKHYEVEEYFYLGIKSEADIRSEFELMDITIENVRYYCLAGTDQASHDRLIYDFSLEYLRLSPDHCISLYGDFFFFLEDMEVLESKGGYYKGWCYKPIK